MPDSGRFRTFTIRTNSSAAQVRLAKRHENGRALILPGSRRITVVTWRVNDRTVGFKMAVVPKSTLALPLAAIALKGIVRDDPPQPTTVMAQANTQWVVYALNVIVAGLAGPLFAILMAWAFDRALSVEATSLNPAIIVPISAALSFLLMAATITQFELQRGRLWRELHGALGHLEGIYSDLADPTQTG